MNNQKTIALLRFALTTIGIAAILLVAYITLGKPDTLTWYEGIMTALVAAFTTDYLNRLA